MENIWLNLMKLFRKILILIETVYHLKNKKKNYWTCWRKSYKFQNLKEKINPNNLLYKYNTEGRSPIYLFINSRDVNINPREVLKFKLTLN